MATRTLSVSSTAASTAIADFSTTVANKQSEKDVVEINASPESTSNAIAPGHPTEQLEVDEAGGNTEENIVYPTGLKLWLTLISLCTAMFLNGLDLTIVAVAVPRLTDQFNTLSDIGWYSAAYGLVSSSCIFFFAKCYTVFRTKHVYLFGITTFEIGSLICTLAPTSKAFIIGRAVAGLGASACGAGMLKMLKDMFPMNRQALMVGIVGGCQAIGLVIAPLVGGLLIDAFSWRACFGVNLPLGFVCIVFTFFCFSDPGTNILEPNQTWKMKLQNLDLLSTAMIVPAIVCLLLAVQWGGIMYGWGNVRIIVLLVLFAVLITAFAYYQYRRGDKATVPPRIIKMRSILGGMWFNSCCNGILAMTEYYISIYFQGVREFTPTKSGLLGLPMIVGLTVASLVAATGTNAIGYYYPFMFATSILAPIASGLLTTIDLDGSIVKPAALMGFLGVAIGFGIQGPILAVQASLPSKDVPLAGAVVGFGGGLGSALWIVVSATLFQSRLTTEILQHSPGANATLIGKTGLSEIRNVVGTARLRDVLLGYNEAVVQTLYMPLALGILTLIGSFAVEKKSLKKKQS